MRTTLETAQTNRARLRDVLCGVVPRIASAIASADAIIAAWSLTAINTTTFGAFADGLTGNDVCAITSGSATLTSADNPWVAGDVGKLIDIAGAGTAGGTHRSRITAFGTAGSITIADVAITTVAPTVTSAAGLAIWGLPQNDMSGYSILPTGGDTYLLADAAMGNSGVIALTAATLTLAAVHNRKIINANRGTDITITLHATAPVGFAVMVEQKGAGQAIFAAGTNATLHNRSTQYKTAGQYAGVTVYVSENSDGLHAVWTLVGDTAA